MQSCELYELYERNDAQAALTEALGAAIAGTGSLVAVSGEAGIGRTVLVSRFTASIGPSTRVLWGACDALLRPRSLGPLHDVAQQAGGRLLAAVTSSAERDALFLALLDELQRSARPTVLVVEDAQWADDATLDLLTCLGRRIARTRSLIVVTYRDDEVGSTHPLRSVLGDVPATVVRRVALAPLSPDAVAALARDAGRGHAAARVYDMTRGNPFYVAALLGADDVGALVPATVRDAVLARAARLGTAARELAELVAVSPTGLEARVIERVMELRAAMIGECLALGVEWRRDGRLAFRHEIARQVVEQAIDPARRRVLHADCLATLLARSDDAPCPARLVQHAQGAGDVAAIVRFGPAAAERAAAAGAHGESASLLGLVLPHASLLMPNVRVGLLERHAAAAHLAGRIDDAIASRYAALDLWRELGDRVREGDTLRSLSRLCWLAGARTDAERLAAQAIAVLEPLPTGRAIGLAYGNVSNLAASADDVAGAVRWGHRALAIAEATGDTLLLAHALHDVGVAEPGHERLARSLGLAIQHEHHEAARQAYASLAACAVRERRYDDARRHVTAGLWYRPATDLDRDVLLGWRARLRFETGDWAGAVEDAAFVLDRCGAAAVRIGPLVVLARVGANRGDAGWQAHLDEASALATAMGEPPTVALVACARAESAWLQGDTSLAPAPLPDAVARQVAGDWRGVADGWRRLGSPHECALTLADSGDEDAMRDALAMLDALGATAAATIVRRRLRAAGARGVPRGIRPTTRRNPAGLTARELEILSLVREGLRDAEIAARLFLSAKTVGHHVSAILAKLGVRSRVEAVGVDLGRRAS